MTLPTANTPGYGLYYAKEYAGGRTKAWVGCDCLLQWLPAANKLLIFKGIITQPLFIWQLTGNEEESAGTHSQGGVFDLGHTSTKIVSVAREMGAPATWLRLPPTFSQGHTHGVLTNCPHNEPARYQIKEQLNGGDGLIGTKPDPHPDPLVYRTWQQGIAYANGVMDPKAFQLRLLKRGYSNSEVKKFQKWIWELQLPAYKSWFNANIYNFDRYGFTEFYGGATARLVQDTYARLNRWYPGKGWDYGVVNDVWPDEPGTAFITFQGGRTYI